MKVKFTPAAAKHYSGFLKRDVTEETFSASVDHGQGKTTITVPFEGKANDGSSLRNIQITLQSTSLITVEA